MSSLLEQLANNESVLMMYLAGELPPEDAAEVEHLLTSDAGLRAELQALRQAQDLVTDQLRQADQLIPAPLGAAASARFMAREAEKWNLRRLSRRPALPSAQRLRYPWWCYPLASAAAVLLAFLAWWGNSNSTPALPTYNNTQLAFELPAEAPDELQSRLRLQQSFEPTPLDEAEEHLAMLGQNNLAQVNELSLQLLP